MNAKKKYLSIEEAANELGIAPGELNRMREKGEVRGFTDRGTWKFLADDVEKLRRSRQVDSDPEVPIFFGLDDDDATITPGDEKSSDSDVRLMVDHPGPARGGLSDSDSDVRLAASKPGKPIDPLAGTDSDVRLFGNLPGKGKSLDLDGSDSDVKLVGERGSKKNHGSNSSVLLTNSPNKGRDSDSDVRLVVPPLPSLPDAHVLDEPTRSGGDSDSDVRLFSAPVSPKSKPNSLVVPTSASLHDAHEPGMADSDSDVRLISSLTTPKSKSTAKNSTPPLAPNGAAGGSTDSSGLLFDGTGVPVVGASDSSSGLNRLLESGTTEKSRSTAKMAKPSVPPLDDELDDTGKSKLFDPPKRKTDAGTDAPIPLSESDMRMLAPSVEKTSRFADLQEDDPDLDFPLTSPAASAKQKQGKKTLDELDEIPLTPLDADDETIDLSPVKGMPAEESGISLADYDEAGESGISLDDGDSGISLDLGDGDSGITLADEAEESGISLGEEPRSKSHSKLGVGRPDDSGIALDRPFKGGKPRAAAHNPVDDDEEVTLAPLGLGDDDLLDTQMEVPLLAGDDDSEFAGDNDATTNVILLDDDDDATAETDTVGSRSKKGFDDAEDEVADFDSSEMVLDDSGELADISDEVVGEDDELDEMDVFEGGDDDSIGEEGETDDDDLAPLPSRAIAAPVEHEWSGIDFALVAFSGLLCVGGAALGFDLMRNLWHTDLANVNPVSSMLLDLFRGMFS